MEIYLNWGLGLKPQSDGGLSLSLEEVEDRPYLKNNINKAKQDAKTKQVKRKYKN
jgi:hypothetical protein